MLNGNDPVKVTNRSNVVVILRKPDDIYFRKEISPGESRTLKYQDIVDIASLPGGKQLIYNFLLIENPNALREGLSVHEEPEYWLTEEMIPEWMNTCPLEEFKNALEYAPYGVNELIKKYATTLPLNDITKRDAIKETLGYDVTKAIENAQEEIVEEKEKNAAKEASRNRTVSFKVPEVEEKKESNIPTYNIVSK